MRKHLALGLSLVALLLASAAAGAKTVLDEKLDMNTLKILARHGQLISLEEKSGKLKYRMVAMMVNTAPDVVWGLITDFKNYDKFVPEMLPPVIEKTDRDGTVVAFTLEIRILGPIKSMQKYKTRYVAKKPRLYMHSVDDPKEEPGYWELVPVDGGKKTLLLYLDIAPDLMKLGSLVVNIVKQKPELGIALQVSPVSVLVQSVKDAAEKKK